MSAILHVSKKAVLPLFTGVFIALALFFVGGSDTFAAAANPSNLSASIVQDADRPEEVINQSSLRTGLTRLINYFLGFLGLLAVAFIIYAGILMVVGEGEEESMTKSRKIIIYAIVGIVIVFLSWTIVNFVAGVPSSVQTGVIPIN